MLYNILKSLKILSNRRKKKVILLINYFSLRLKKMLFESSLLIKITNANSLLSPFLGKPNVTQKINLARQLDENFLSFFFFFYPEMIFKSVLKILSFEKLTTNKRIILFCLSKIIGQAFVYLWFSVNCKLLQRVSNFRFSVLTGRIK